MPKVESNFTEPTSERPITSPTARRSLHAATATSHNPPLPLPRGDSFVEDELSLHLVDDELAQEALSRSRIPRGSHRTAQARFGVTPMHTNDHLDAHSSYAASSMAHARCNDGSALEHDHLNINCLRILFRPPSPVPAHIADLVQPHLPKPRPDDTATPNRGIRSKSRNSDGQGENMGSSSINLPSGRLMYYPNAAFGAPRSSSSLIPAAPFGTTFSSGGPRRSSGGNSSRIPRTPATSGISRSGPPSLTLAKNLALHPERVQARVEEEASSSGEASQVGPTRTKRGVEKMWPAPLSPPLKSFSNRAGPYAHGTAAGRWSVGTGRPPTIIFKRHISGTCRERDAPPCSVASKIAASNTRLLKELSSMSVIIIFSYRSYIVNTVAHPCHSSVKGA